MRASTWSWLTASLVLLVAWQADAGQAKPAVLFVGGVHSRYVAQPLHEMGIELAACKAGEVASRLADGKVNVVVAGTLNDEDRKAVADFLARGGGALVCSPEAWSESKQWTATNQWLADLGARPRWEVLRDGDRDNVVRDLMGCRLSWSGQVSPPVSEGVRGVLTLLWAGTGGCEPPMSFDLGPEWKAVVRGAAYMQAKPDTRHDDYLQPWMPREPGPAAPPLLALRDAGKGRLAVMAIRYYWIFTPPSHCPTAEAMLTAGAGGKPSDWLRVFANTFRWLAEPSLAAGMGGAPTPDSLLHPPVQVWEPPKTMQWAKPGSFGNQSQVTGLIGARTALSSGSGTVADYAAAAKAAGLQFIAFLEDSLKMDQAKWDRLVAACDAASDASFAAVPGLTYEDAQGDHLYAFADEVKFPKPDMLLPDGRLATNQSGRTKAYFDYVNEYMQQHALTGFWRHKENWLDPADYKLYNSFPVYSNVDGKPVDDGFDSYAYFMGIGGAQAVLAFEIMSSPDQVAGRARDGWKVVWTRSVADLRGKWYHGAWSFHGMMSQYITNGPKLLAWEAPNRLVDTHGQWWRPDLAEFRVRLRAASDVGLKSVTLYDGPRVFRRWLPGGAKTFETELVLANCMQLGLFPVVEDLQGRKAIGMESWNRILLMEEFFCSDRCNVLGNCRLRTRDGRQVWTQVSFQGNMGNTPSKGRLGMSAEPAVCLTLDSPTLPIDGRPMGFPTVALRFQLQPPGELEFLFAYPETYMVGPEIAVGQADYRLGYDPAEEGAKATRLGHPYEQPQHGWGNSWGSWHRLVPTRKLSGWARTYACNWLPETFRIGWHEANVTLKEPVTLDQGGLQVMHASMPGWAVYRGDEAIASPEKPSDGPFVPGTYAILEDKGGSVVVAALDGQLRFRCGQGGTLSLAYAPERLELAKGDAIRFTIGFAGAASGTTTAQLLDFARKFGIAAPGRPGYSPQMIRGKQIDTCLVWRLDGQGAGIEARVPKADLPGFLPVSVEGLHDNWSVLLLDRARQAPNFRSLPCRDGRAFAQLDPAGGGLDLFIGHPVTSDRPEVALLVAWQEPGVWFVEAHNPTDGPVEAQLRTASGWDLFSFQQAVDLAPGTSRTWQVKEKER